MDHFLCLRKAAKQSTVLGRKRALSGEEICKSTRHIKQCCRMKQAAFKTEQHTKLRPANAGSVLEHRPENRPQIAWRVGDDLQHLGGRGLLLTRFRQLLREPLDLLFQVKFQLIKLHPTLRARNTTEYRLCEGRS